VAGNIFHLPLPPGTGGKNFRAGWSDFILPGLAAFKPELLIISAGFDAHEADPLAQLRLQVADFTWITQQLLAVADASCPGRVVSLLEGGYDLEALAECAAAHVRALLRL
jgi:acetoin utilization deacetylase AcuC-like enzyme